MYVMYELDWLSEQRRLPIPVHIFIICSVFYHHLFVLRPVLKEFKYRQTDPRICNIARLEPIRLFTIRAADFCIDSSYERYERYERYALYMFPPVIGTLPIVSTWFLVSTCDPYEPTNTDIDLFESINIV